MSEIAKTAPSFGAIDRQQRRKDNPLLWLPREWRAPVGFFVQFHSDILKGENGIVTRLRFWIKDDALTLDEATLVMRRLMRPDVCARLTYAGQLLAELAVQVEQVVRDRRARERQERARADAEAAKRGAVDGSEVRRLLGSIGQDAGD